MPPNAGVAFKTGQYCDVLLRDGTRRSCSKANVPDCSGTIEWHMRAALAFKDCFQVGPDLARMSDWRHRKPDASGRVPDVADSLEATFISPSSDEVGLFRLVNRTVHQHRQLQAGMYRPSCSSRCQSR